MFTLLRSGQLKSKLPIELVTDAFLQVESRFVKILRLLRNNTGILYFFILQVNRSSLLVPGEMTKPQEVNGTNGRAASPARDKMKSADQSSDSEQDEAGDEDELANSKRV